LLFEFNYVLNILEEFFENLPKLFNRFYSLFFTVNLCCCCSLQTSEQQKAATGGKLKEEKAKPL